MQESGWHRGLADSIHRAIADAKAQPAPGSPEAEAASDALLAKERAWNDGAHSERPDTKYNRKHSSHRVCDPTAALEVIDRYIETQDIIADAAASIPTREYMVWHYCDREGVPQILVAEALGVSDRTVRRILANAREELKYTVQSHIRTIFRREVRDKHAYHDPPTRPALTLDVELARERIETMPELTTHIMPDDTKLVEVWVNGERPLDIHNKPVGAKRVCSLKERIKVKILYRRRLVKAKAKKTARKTA